MNNEYTFDRVFRLALSVISVAAIVWLLGYLSEVLVPFAVAFLAAYLVHPIVSKTEKELMPGKRTLAVSVTLVGIVGAVAGSLYLLIPMIADEIKRSAGVIKKVVTSADVAKVAQDTLPPGVWDWITNFIQTHNVADVMANQSLMDGLFLAFQKIFPGIVGLASGALGIVAGIFGLTVVVLYIIFLLIDYDNFTENWIKIVPDKYQKALTEFLAEFEKGMSRYFRAQAIVAGLVGILFAVGFKIIGLPMAIFLGLLIGALNMIPYLQIAGIFPAVFLAVVHALDTGGSIAAMIGLTLAVFAVVQIIQDALIVPKIMGDVTGLSPAVILLSLSVWGKLLGMLGLLIALPMTVLFWAYYQRFKPKTGAA